ncbi:hypothetical protein A5886_002855 [Enterococcus sp. 8G7_MSG3316]|uniref:Apea-like HEPN domain-containing protein n=1 Tax=Candidatus Enterococcus testudinis TaxID=1834191 RepID=A0A242A9P6_9ENTE|nr:hypothetical protein [Enterococcus sp. 8G7_MSG3316]OTN77754.1 hypothetical protein A5886_002855 [Enterococcus sp. 8G7_MSG3316]
MVLKDYKNSKLKKFKISTDGEIIFVQKFTEVLYHDSFHSYKYMLHNSYTLIEEILHTLEDVYAHIISVNHLRKLIEELKYFSDKDIILNQEFPQVGYIIRSLKEKTLKEEEPYSLRNLEFKLKGIFDELQHSYFKKLITQLKNEIDKQSVDVDAISDLTQYLVSHCITKFGIHSRSLTYIMKTIFVSTNPRDKQPSFDDKWLIFISFLESKKYEEQMDAYVLVRPLTDKISADILSDIGVKYMSRTDLEQINFVNEKEALNRLGDATYISYRGLVKKENLYASINEVMEIIEQELSIAAFNNEPVYLDKTSVIVLIKTTDEAYKIIAKDRLFNISSNRKRNIVSNGFSQIKMSIDTKSIKDKERIYSSLKNYSMGQSSFSTETSFIMYWSSLENLLKVGSYRSVNDYLAHSVPTLMTLKYSRGLLENFFLDLIGIGIKEVVFSEDEFIFHLTYPMSSLKMTTFLKLVRTRKPSNLDLLLENYSLLAYRWEKVKKLFSDDDELALTLMNHQKKIEWHILRLYRVRNKIVHSASTDNNILSLTQHLDFYTREIISEILNSIDCIKEKQLPAALMALDLKSDYLKYVLSNTKKNLNYDELNKILFPEKNNYL